jgi:selenoprotein W-related protein
MAEQLLGEFEEQIEAITLIPSGGGRFEVTVDGDLVYSKLGTGSHADYEDVAGPIRGR